jgi:glycosyltransferase involved in cell wall biosynthesis
MSSRGVSVVICTYNGASKLPETIRYIANQKVPKHIPWEFVIIDNASSDNTAAIARDVWNKYSCQNDFRIVHEPQPGLSYARTRGFASARFDYILLCDDDNWLNPHYIERVYEVMSAHENIGALGGNGELVFEEEPPAWVRAYSVYAAGQQAEKSGMAKRNTVYGAGCVIRKSAYDILQLAGYRSLLTDRLGKELSSGGDYELCLALVIAGFHIWYDEQLTFKHFITKDRITMEYYKKYLKESAKCFEVLNPYKVICEWSTLNVKSFRLRMAQSLFYFIRTFVKLEIMKARVKKDDERYTILSLQSYSVRHMIEVYTKNWKKIIANYKHGKVLQQKFSKTSRWKFLETAKASLLSITK